MCGEDREEKKVHIEIEPELSACVETKARKEYDRILISLLKEGEKEELIEKLEVLKLFLESTDFGKLRSDYEKYLPEGRKVKFILRSAEGKAKYEVKIE